MLLIPYRVDVPMERQPIANWLLIGITSLVSLAAMRAWSTGDPEVFGWTLNLVHDGFNPLGMVGCVLLHADPIHLIGNMLFLWVFGNAICAKLGNISYPFVYVAMAFASSLTNAVFGEGAGIGASGAVNGIVGLYLVLYPINEIDCLWWFFTRGGHFSAKSYWMILLWLAFDVWGVVSGGSGVAYWAHIGGLAAGVGLGFILVHFGWVRMASYEKSLYAVWRGREPHPATSDDESTDDQTDDGRELGRELLTPTSPAKIHVLCGCGKKLSVDRRYAGRKGRCPGCRNEVLIPSA